MSVTAAAETRREHASRALERRGFALATATVMGAALLLRAHDLLSLPIFNDEAVYLRWAADILDQRTRMSLFIPVAEDGKQPLYIWLAAAAMSVVSDPLLAGRLVSVVAGLLSVAGITFAGRWLHSRLLGLMAGFVYAVAPYGVLFDRMALADSVVNTAVIWAFALGVMMARRDCTRRVILLWGAILGAVVAMGMWTKLTVAFALPFPVLCLLLLTREGRPWRPRIEGMAVAYLVFGVLASFLVLMPYAENQLILTATHTFSPNELTASRPVNVWLSNSAKYWSWIEAYLPAPLYWLVPIGAAWGLIFQRRKTLLLVACWIAIVVPSVVLARTFSSRYLLDSVFPLILLAALPASGVWEQLGSQSVRMAGIGGRRAAALAIGAPLAIAIAVTSVSFDLRLITDPASAVAMPATDRDEYVEGWASGYGFKDALDLALRRANEYDRNVFVLSDQFQGLPFDGLALYVRGMPRVRHYVDARIAWGEDGIADTWRSHAVPLILVRNDGRGNYGSFESRVPEARLIGTFWKPGGKKSFRVYELDPQSVPTGK